MKVWQQWCQKYIFTVWVHKLWDTPQFPDICLPRNQWIMLVLRYTFLHSWMQDVPPPKLVLNESKSRKTSPHNQVNMVVSFNLHVWTIIILIIKFAFLEYYYSISISRGLLLGVSTCATFLSIITMYKQQYQNISYIIFALNLKTKSGQ
jgi:hypothetical protein